MCPRGQSIESVRLHYGRWSPAISSEDCEWYHTLSEARLPSRKGRGALRYPGLTTLNAGAIAAFTYSDTTWTLPAVLVAAPVPTTDIFTSFKIEGRRIVVPNRVSQWAAMMKPISRTHRDLDSRSAVVVAKRHPRDALPSLTTRYRRSPCVFVPCVEDDLSGSQCPGV